jgi:hypothetical protein
VSQLPEYPRLLFSIRISEDIKPGDLSTELLTDWLSTLPVEAKSVRVEAGFASDSTLLIVSMPIALLGYLPYDPAITLIGTARSNNQVSVENKVIEAAVRIPYTFSFKSIIKSTEFTLPVSEWPGLVRNVLLHSFAPPTLLEYRLILSSYRLC